RRPCLRPAVGLLAFGRSVWLFADLRLSLLSARRMPPSLGGMAMDAHVRAVLRRVVERRLRQGKPKDQERAARSDRTPNTAIRIQPKKLGESQNHQKTPTPTPTACDQRQRKSSCVGTPSSTAPMPSNTSDA